MNPWEMGWQTQGVGRISGNQAGELARAIQQTATELGVDPVDLATVMAYETGGSFDPWQRGPTTQWGVHRGLIQWGEPQARQYGVSKNTPITDQVRAAGNYLRDAGVKPGMGLLDLYSAVNAGRVGRYNASDRPGYTVRSHVAGMGGARDQAETLMAYAPAGQQSPGRMAINAAFQPGGRSPFAQVPIPAPNLARNFGSPSPPLGLPPKDDDPLAARFGDAFGRPPQSTAAPLMPGPLPMPGNPFPMIPQQGQTAEQIIRAAMPQSPPMPAPRPPPLPPMHPGRGTAPGSAQGTPGGIGAPSHFGPSGGGSANLGGGYQGIGYQGPPGGFSLINDYTPTWMFEPPVYSGGAASGGGILGALFGGR